MGENNFEMPSAPRKEGLPEDPVIGHLDLNNPEERAYAAELDESKAELRRETLEKYSTPEEAVEPYRQGEIELYELEVSYTPEEVQGILDECRKRNEAEKSGETEE